MIKALQNSNVLWKDLPWETFQRTVSNLQRRIYEAKLQNNYQNIIKLQKLLINSKSAKFLAVYHLSKYKLQNTVLVQRNNPFLLSDEQKFEVVNQLNEIENWKHHKIYKHFNINSTHSRYPFIFLSIKDQAAHLLIKYALEPCCEAYFSPYSYGFRPSVNIYEIQRDILYYFTGLSKRNGAQILIVNFEQCLNDVDHNKLLSSVILPTNIKNIIWKALKAGLDLTPPLYLEETRHGKILTPLLTNILLHGVENLSSESIRYLNTIIFFLKNTENPYNILQKVYDLLKEKRLDPNKAKIKITSPQEGFDFLYWHFKKTSQDKVFSIPNKNSLKKIKKQIKVTLRDTRYSMEERLEKIKFYYSQWWKYHKFCNMNLIKSSLWGMRKSTYKYIRKATKINIETAGIYVRNIFSGHKYLANGYIKKYIKNFYDN
uniref:Maturase n=2 Tax=Bangiopsis subsimplex TaxID=139980 RepID=A0A1C9CCS7_9RHOD|nr:maturase [Bangiopsis subsimplex]AOM66154.1 maturase [Bangiopsis subsimplex]